MQIGEVAKLTGIGVETVRYYEREGLISKSSRTSSGYRHFSNNALKQIRFIQYAKSAGFSLKEIKELRLLKENPNVTCQQSHEKIRNKINEIKLKINSLENMLNLLQSQLDQCLASAKMMDCSVLHAIGLDASESALHKKE